MEILYPLFFAVVIVAVTVVPVTIAAKWARARRAGFLPALAAVILATVVAQLALMFTGDAMVGLLVAFVAGCAAYALVLGTSFVAAVGIAVVSVVLQVGILIGLVLLGLQLPAVVTLPF